jgi:hypothetical protein
VYAAIDDFEAESLVGVDGYLVVDPGVGRDLVAALGSGPFFGGAHEGGTDASLAEGLLNEPAFDEADEVGDVASVGVGTKACVEEAGYWAVVVLGYEDRGWESAVSSGAEDGGEFGEMVFGWRVGPEECAHCGEIVLVE